MYSLQGPFLTKTNMNFNPPSTSGSSTKPDPSDQTAQVSQNFDNC